MDIFDFAREMGIDTTNLTTAQLTELEYEFDATMQAHNDELDEHNEYWEYPRSSGTQIYYDNIDGDDDASTNEW